MITLFDGAFGTYYYKKTGKRETPELANLSEPEIVSSIHREYVAAGANAIKTNTFGANCGLCDNYAEIIKKGYEIACDAVKGTDTQVYGDIGPVNTENEGEELIKCAEIFLSCGANKFLLETFASAEGPCEAVKYIKEKCPDSIVTVSFAVNRDGYSSKGLFYLSLLEQAAKSGADRVGLNCVCGPDHMLKLIQKIPKGKYRLSVMPNAGYPALVNGRNMYIDNPDYFAGKISDIASCGAEAVGGCCGTTPAHIEKAGKALERRENNPVSGQEETNSSRTMGTDTSEYFTRKRKIVAVEITPPDKADFSYALSAARTAKRFGADFLTVPDSPLARSCANSMAIASMLHNETGMKVIPHLTCRDRNSIAIKGDLIGGALSGIDSVLVITGDAAPEAERNSVKSFFSFNSYKLIEYVKSLNNEVFYDSPFAVAGAININAPNPDAEIERAAKKIKCGADGFFTQPVYSEKTIEVLKRIREKLNCKLIAGIMPVAGYKNALFMNNEIPGVSIPAEFVDSLKDKTREEAAELSARRCAELIDKMYDTVDGFYLVTPLKRFDITEKVISYIRSKE